MNRRRGGVGTRGGGMMGGWKTNVFGKNFGSCTSRNTNTNE